MNNDPYVQFSDWFSRAKDTYIDKPNAMILSTVNDSNHAVSRVVLLSSFNANGFVFHTNYNSHKSHQLEINSQASLLFWWDELGYQIRIQGQVEKTSHEDSDRYFAGRPRGSQIGAWASRQSHPINERQVLELAVEKYSQQFAGQEVPRPEFWGGFRLIPNYFEFWSNRDSRLHERKEFKLQDNEQWRVNLISP